MSSNSKLTINMFFVKKILIIIIIFLDAGIGAPPPHEPSTAALL
eukprot:gene3852-8387_t